MGNIKTKKRYKGLKENSFNHKVFSILAYLLSETAKKTAKNVKDLLNHELVVGGLIRFLGFVPSSELDDILKQAIIALLPFFGLPRWGGQMTKTLKLMSYGLCVVASPEAVKWIRGAKPSIHYVTVGCVDDCVKVLNELLDDVKTCLNMGVSARSLVKTSHTWNRVCGNYLHIIKRMVSQL